VEQRRTEKKPRRRWVFIASDAIAGSGSRKSPEIKKPAVTMTAGY
jgi:hypothetical protein